MKALPKGTIVCAIIGWQTVKGTVVATGKVDGIPAVQIADAYGHTHTIDIRQIVYVTDKLGTFSADEFAAIIEANPSLTAHRDGNLLTLTDGYTEYLYEQYTDGSWSNKAIYSLS